MIDHASKYTFEFRWNDARGQTQLRRRVVLIVDLWKSFDLAANWRRTGKLSEGRTCSFYGPGIGRSLCDELARDHLRETLEPLGLVPLEAAYCGLLWAWLDGEYALYKVRTETVELEGYERPHLVHYGLDRVEDDKIGAVFKWSHEKCWFDKGVWINDHPAIAFMGNHIVLWQALGEIPQVAKYFVDGRLPSASVRYDYRNSNPKYPYMAPTRLRDRIQDLRSRYPFATEDLAVVPQVILQRDYGYGISTGISPTPAFSG